MRCDPQVPPGPVPKPATRGASRRGDGGETQNAPASAGASWCAVARGGVEPPTYRFSVGRSYQLSYLAEARGTIPESPVQPETGRARWTSSDGGQTGSRGRRD